MGRRRCGAKKKRGGAARRFIDDAASESEDGGAAVSSDEPSSEEEQANEEDLKFINDYEEEGENSNDDEVHRVRISRREKRLTKKDLELVLENVGLLQEDNDKQKKHRVQRHHHSSTIYKDSDESNACSSDEGFIVTDSSDSADSSEEDEQEEEEDSLTPTPQTRRSIPPLRKRIKPTSKEDQSPPMPPSVKSGNEEKPNNDNECMSEHLQRWTKFDPVDSSVNSAVRYLKTRMYINEDMMIIVDKLHLTRLAYALYEYRNKIVEPCMAKKPPPTPPSAQPGDEEKPNNNNNNNKLNITEPNKKQPPPLPGMTASQLADFSDFYSCCDAQDDDCPIVVRAPLPVTATATAVATPIASKPPLPTRPSYVTPVTLAPAAKGFTTPSTYTVAGRKKPMAPPGRVKPTPPTRSVAPIFNKGHRPLPPPKKGADAGKKNTGFPDQQEGIYVRNGQLFYKDKDGNETPRKWDP